MYKLSKKKPLFILKFEYGSKEALVKQFSLKKFVSNYKINKDIVNIYKVPKPK